MTRLAPALPARHPQRGAATLVIVMVLFLIMALLAAYGNRALLFEQRIANSYYRASVAQEAGEAGVEWSLAQLNGGAVDGDCAPVSTGGTRFVDRYLAISSEDRSIKRAGAASEFMTDCAKSGSSWACHCPALGAWTPPTAAAGTAMSPSFGVNIQEITSTSSRMRGGAFRLRVQGCTTNVVSACRETGTNSRAGQGTSIQDATIALVSAVRSPPAAPLVVKGSVTVTGTGGLGLHNTDARSGGLLYDVGGGVTGFSETRLNSVPGTASAQARVANDDTLVHDAVDPTQPADVFRMFMGTTANRYKTHPALREVACNGDCGTDLAAAYASGRRMMWVEGNLSLDSALTLGSAADPVVLVVNGNVTITSAVQIFGMVVARGDVAWTNSAGTSQIVGMLLAEGNVVTTGAMDIVYLSAIANQLRNRVGSFVRVPGGWTDLR